MCFLEGKKVKKIEGIPVTDEEVLRDVEMAEGKKRAKKAVAQSGD